jgi:hypothetical protein
MEITPERSEQFVKMFKYLAGRGYKLEYRDNSFHLTHGIQYIEYPCSFQLLTLSQGNKQIAELKQDKGIFTFKEF